jgi:hypothetical protein
MSPQWQLAKSPGEQTPPTGHVQAPHWQLDEQVSVPYVLHGWVAPAEHAPPDPQEHAPHVQLDEHVETP